jgi:hypothetical protein
MNIGHNVVWLILVAIGLAAAVLIIFRLMAPKSK